ncbi:MAG TPA: hypothetical protein VND94_15530 [Terriglobia bacterium]|nr:hypothetical protein [Terriglobia bacterium]
MGIADGAADERVGIILVHGIGEQRRFEHLDGQLRELLETLQVMNGVVEVSVDIANPGATSFHAQKDGWLAGPDPSVTVVVHHRIGGTDRIVHLCVHEVWWADINEDYSLAKQFRFWAWGLAIWLHPGKPGSNRPTAHLVTPPRAPRRLTLWSRIRLFLTGVFFVLIGFSVGSLIFLANRLFNWQSPDLLKVVTNYVSGVKLYTQRHRYSGGLLWEDEAFLDNLDLPPRVSIRRRMIRAIADATCQDYDRWYVLAHSLGSVLAFNGLMETAYVWPGYLDRDRWNHLTGRRDAGPPRDANDMLEFPRSQTEPVMPPRPAWVPGHHIVYRDQIFARCRGLLTYGSPLEKFAHIWPAIVPIATRPAFSADMRWINLCDPLDPVSGVLRSFTDPTRTSNVCPQPDEHGYGAAWWLLLAHLCYFRPRGGQGSSAAAATLEWLLTDVSTGFRNKQGGLGNGSWYQPNSPVFWLRQAIATLSWLIAAAILAALGAYILPALVHAIHDIAVAVWAQVCASAPTGTCAPVQGGGI